MERGKKRQIIISGLGGQGVVMAGVILSHAAFLDGKNVVQTQSYGPEARGSFVSSEIVISDSKINYPKVVECDVFIALSPEAIKSHYQLIKPNGVVLHDSDLVKKLPKRLLTEKVFMLPAKTLAEKELCSPVYANIIALGAISALTKIVKHESLTAAIQENVPSKALEKNLRALQIGYTAIKAQEGRKVGKE